MNIFETIRSRSSYCNIITFFIIHAITWIYILLFYFKPSNFCEKFTPDIFKTQLLSPPRDQWPRVACQRYIGHAGCRHVATNHYCGAQTPPAIWRIGTENSTEFLTKRTTWQKTANPSPIFISNESQLMSCKIVVHLQTAKTNIKLEASPRNYHRRC